MTFIVGTTVWAREPISFSIRLNATHIREYVVPVGTRGVVKKLGIESVWVTWSPRASPYPIRRSMWVAYNRLVTRRADLALTVLMT